MLALSEVASLLGKPLAPILPPWGGSLAAAALRPVGIRIPDEVLRAELSGPRLEFGDIIGACRIALPAGSRLPDHLPVLPPRLYRDHGKVEAGLHWWSGRHGGPWGTRGDLQAIGALCLERRLWLVSDEAYEDIVFEGGKVMVKGAPARAKSFAEIAGFAYIPVPLPAGLGVEGVVLADQLRSLDWRARRASVQARLPDAVVAAVLARARTLL